MVAKRKNMKNKVVVFGGTIAISMFLMFSMSIAGVFNPDHFLGSNLKVETETDNISIDTDEGYTKLNPEVDNVFSNIEDKSSTDLEDSDNNMDDDNEEPCVFCADCFVNTIEGTAKLCDGSNAPDINVQVQSSSGTKTTSTGSSGYWQVDVGSLTGGNWTWGSSFTVTYSGSCSGISWTGSDSGTVSQPPTCLYDCGTTTLSPLNSLTATAGGSPITIDEGDTVSFTGSASGGYPSYSWYWDFDGDGASSLQSPSHQFNTAGVYDCTLTVTDSCSDTDDDIVTIAVSAPNNDPNNPSIPSGPATRDTGQSGTYSTSATDPDSNQVQYMFDWNASGSHDYSSWTALGASGHSDSSSHSWGSAGTYVVKALARDEYGAISDWSSGLTVIVRSPTNNPPNAFIDSIIPNPANQGQTVAFTGHGTDPDTGDTITGYNWRSNSDGELSTIASFSSSTLSAGTHTIYFKVQDNHGAWSTEVSQTLTINPASNNPPNKPITPNGMINGKVGNSYPYLTNATDPDGDKLKYGWDKDSDGTVDIWDDNGGSYYISGLTINTSISWSSRGTYSLKVIAEDEHGARSPWSDPLSVSMPKSRVINGPFFNFFENNPEMFPILRLLFQRLGL